MKELQYSVLELFMSSNHYFNLLVLLVQLVLWVLWFRLGQLHLNFPLFGHVRLLRTLFGYTVTANAAFWIPSPAI